MTRRKLFASLFALPVVAVSVPAAVPSGESEVELIRRNTAAKQLACSLAQLRDEVDALRLLKGGHYLSEEEYATAMIKVSSVQHACSAYCSPSVE